MFVQRSHTLKNEIAESGQEILKEPSVFDCSYDIPWYQCLKCPNYQTKFLLNLRQHVRYRHRTTSSKYTIHKCRKCDLETYSKYFLLRHGLFAGCALKGADKRKNQRVVCENDRLEAVSAHKCLFCSYKSEAITDLVIHIFSKHVKFPKTSYFQCDHCSRHFKLKKTLKTHTKSMLRPPDNPHRCEYCPFGTIWKCQLKKHVISKHSSETEFHCEKCSTSFKTQLSLKRHKKTYHETRPEDTHWFICDQCASKFRSNTDLTRHVVALHTSPEDVHWFGCDQCTSKFKREILLKNHQKFCHSDPEAIPWVTCDLCPAKFKHKCSLRAHLKTCHTDPDDIEWFECELCEAQFQFVANLRMHMKRCHLQSFEWYGCEKCPYKAKEKRSLKNHVLANHTDVEWLECEHCKYRTKVGRYLREHAKRCRNK